MYGQCVEELVRILHFSREKGTDFLPAFMSTKDVSLLEKNEELSSYFLKSP
jgi:hypothetical protein